MSNLTPSDCYFHTFKCFASVFLHQATTFLWHSDTGLWNWGSSGFLWSLLIHSKHFKPLLNCWLMRIVSKIMTESLTTFYYSFIWLIDSDPVDWHHKFVHHSHINYLHIIKKPKHQLFEIIQRWISLVVRKDSVSSLHSNLVLIPLGLEWAA